MIRAARMEVIPFTLPLGSGRGGSDATEVQVALADAEGVEGTGFTYSLTGALSGTARLLEGELPEVVVGSDLAFWPRTWQRVWQAGHRLGRGSVMPALSALDIAVWDLRPDGPGNRSTASSAPTTSRCRSTAVAGPRTGRPSRS